MNFTELNNYKLSDAVKFHNRLNPRLWGKDEHLLPEVRDKLLEIAADFQEFLGISDLDLVDITFSGSNAAFSYTPHSDIDLHLVVRAPAGADEVYKELFNAKKYQYNDLHNIKVRGADVELYVQPAEDEVVSLGEYSIKDGKWLQVPRRKRATIDQNLVKHKYEDLQARIVAALKEDDPAVIQQLISKIKTMRQTGLDQHGEFGPENLAYKMLRTQGWIDKLYAAQSRARDKELSLKEKAKNPTSKPGAWWRIGEDNTGMAQGSTIGDAGAQSTWDGVSPDTDEFLSEQAETESIVRDFIRSTAQQLGIKRLPKIVVHKDSAWSEKEHSFGRFVPETHELHVSLANRHLMDILRTTAHELAHCKQHEIAPLPDDAGATGSKWENQAHAVAGVVMRKFADRHPELFESSGYIPTTAEKNDPRYVMALSPDVRPGATGLNANKMALKTDAQGKPALLMKTVNLQESMVQELAAEFALLESEVLSEIRMSTANLRQLAAKTGAQAGMEFEMIVPNVADTDNDDQEHDYDQDQRARSISDIVDFFYDGDFNSRREIQRLEESLNEAYRDWKWDQLSEKWDEEGYEYFIQYIEDQDLFDRDEALDTARDEFVDANPDIPVDSEEAQRGISARVDELEQEFIQEMWDDRGRYYDNAQEMFNDDHSEDFDESDWLRSESYHSMSDIENNFDIQWPYWTSGGDGEADIEAVSNEFEDMIGRPVHWSTSYHGATRSPTAYSVEPDGSLDADAPGDSGLEFISPPLPIDEMISDLNKVKEWAGRYGCYTNDSTGLHINISVPGYSLDKLDYVKLALLMGDEYVLDLFGRASNTYAKAATGKIKNAIRTNPSVVADLLDKMRGHMGDLATKAIHSGTTDKYTSINTKNGYIEFRSPGGDWLDANFDKIENTLLRFTVALSAAIDPQAYRQEYQKKLYKLLSASQDKGGQDVVQLFANYSAGELDKAGLIRQVRQQQTARAVKSGKTYGKKFWWSVTNPANNFASIEVVAKSKEEAIDVAVEPGNYPEWARVRDSLDATPIRPYQEPSASGNTASWGLFRVSDNTRMKAHGNYVQFDNVTQADAQKQADELIARTSFSPSNFEIRKVEAPGAGQPQTPMGGQSYPREPAAGRIEYQIFNRNDNSAVVAMMADNDEQALERLGRYRADHPGNWGVRRAGEPDGFDTNNDNYGATERRGDLTPRGPGPWEIYRISNGESVRELSHTSRSAAEQEARTALGLRAEAPELYGVRTRQSAATTNYRGPWEIFRIEDGRVMGTIAAGNHAEAEVEMERRARNASYDPDVLDIRPAQQSAAQPGDVVAPGLGEVPADANQVGQVYTPTGRGEFTGQWMILDPSDRILHKLGGIGNNQNDANRHALRWLQQHPEHMQDGVTIVPEMG